MKIAKKRKAGEILERSGISQRIINIAAEIAEGTYKEAIEKAGQISVLVDAASFEYYWEEKAAIGRNRECNIFEDLLSGALKRDKLIGSVNPYGSDKD